MKTVRFGLIGMGIHGMRYARHIMRDIEGAELYAVCRQDPARGAAFAREHNVRYYREYLDVLSDPKVDAVAHHSALGLQGSPGGKTSGV